VLSDFAKDLGVVHASARAGTMGSGTSACSASASSIAGLLGAVSSLAYLPSRQVTDTLILWSLQTPRVSEGFFYSSAQAGKAYSFPKS